MNFSVRGIFFIIICMMDNMKDGARQTRKPGTIESKRPTKKLDNISKNAEEQEEIDTYFDSYCRAAVSHFASEDSRKSQLNSAINQIQFLQNEIDNSYQKVREIKQRMKLIEFSKNSENTLKKRINQYKEMGQLNCEKISELVQEFEKGIDGLPMTNIHLPQTKSEGDNVVEILKNMSNDLEIRQNRNETSIPAIDLVENLKETNKISVSLDEYKQSFQKNTALIKDLTMEEAFLKLAVSYEPKPTWDIVDLLKD